MPLERRVLPAGGFVDHDPAWLSRSEAETLHRELVSGLVWEQRAIVLFGREVQQPRLIAWAGALPYRYSGQTLEPREAPPALSSILARVAQAASAPFNHVLVNRYRDGNDSMGMHADDEPELGRQPVVATLSLGATRKFTLAPVRRSFPKETFSLTSGSLLVMGGACQRMYRHGIPKERGVTEERVSLTLRLVLREPDSGIRQGERILFALI